jgi:hypothetical protein
VGPSPKTCVPVLCDSISYVEVPRAYLCVHKKRNTHRSMTSSPAIFCRWGRGYAELPLNGVLISSQRPETSRGSEFPCPPSREELTNGQEQTRKRHYEEHDLVDVIFPGWQPAY